MKDNLIPKILLIIVIFLFVLTAIFAVNKSGINLSSRDDETKKTSIDSSTSNDCDLAQRALNKISSGQPPTSAFVEYLDSCEDPQSFFAYLEEDEINCGKADINNDETVNVQDLIIITSNWNSYYPPYDIDKDSNININELISIITNWECQYEITSYACSGLEGAALDSCMIANQFDQNINSGMGWSEFDNHEKRLTWYESYVQRSYLDLYYLTGNSYYLDKLVVHIDNVVANRDDLIGYYDWQGLSLPGWSFEQTLTGEGVRLNLHSAVITYPMVEFAKTIYSTTSLHQPYLQKANEYISITEEVLLTHEPDYIQGPDEIVLDDEGYYIRQLGAPVPYSDHKAPNNYQMAIGTAFITLYQLTKNPDYLDRALRLGRVFKRDIEVDQNNANVWEYWIHEPPEEFPKYEDTNHGFYDIYYALKMYEENRMMERADMERFGYTLTENIYQGNPYEKAWRVDGSMIQSYYIERLGRWLDLTNFNTQIDNIIIEMYEENDFVNGVEEDYQQYILGFSKIAKWQSPLLAKYTFDDNTYDLSGHWHAGRIEGNPSYIEGIQGKAILLDGIDDFVNIESSRWLNPSKSFALSIWIKPTQFDIYDLIIERYDGSNDDRSYFLHMREMPGVIRFSIYNENQDNTFAESPPNSIPIGEWSHVAGTYDENEGVKLYINGNLISTGSAIGPIKQSSTETTIGGFMNPSSNYFNGAIDEVEIYRYLTDEQVQEIYQKNSQQY